jgi:polyferredoxin
MGLVAASAVTRTPFQFTSRFADFLRDHAPLLRRLQWGIVLVYFTLLIVPVLLPLPDNAAGVFNNLTVFAQFAFWGIWWPFVLVSMPLLGRAWCGWLCPEGMLTEWASERGLGRSIPRWVRWGGWPFVAFLLTTLYGQLISVYQYPLAVLLILGGSTAGAMLVGFLYGRSKRVWCRFLCPVNGVFNLLAKLAPWHFKVNEEAWRASLHAQPQNNGQATISLDSMRKALSERNNQFLHAHAINCAPMVPLRHMKGAGDCHVCGRCSGYRDAIALTPRSPEEEIVRVAEGNAWQTALICLGLMGAALGAFLWSASPWYVTMKQAIAEWLINRDIFWPLMDNAPWFILTHYPEVNDSFSWLDGGLIVLFMTAAALVSGGALYLALWLANRLAPPVQGHQALEHSNAHLHHPVHGLHKLAQALIPTAGVGVFLGLSATTITLLKHEGLGTDWATPVRFTLLALAVLWALRLMWRVLSQRTPSWPRRLLAMLFAAAGLAPFCAAWVLFFAVW